MSRLVARAESFERIYTAFQNINFAAFDYNTIKQSLIEYIKLYFPETFNDYIESSEFIALIESFAYICEQIAYRLDVISQENFISTAQRRDSILRLAKLISYKADRSLPARGLVKFMSISTTEPVVDTNGNNLANTTIRWNDVNNVDWKQQFILVMNRVLEQTFGSVRPQDRFQIENVVFELYGLNLTPLTLGVFQYSTQVSGTSVSMELVPITHDTSLGIIERRPQNNADFTIVYGTDGLGDASDTTGFFCFTKQGTMQRFRTSFDGITPNQTYLTNAVNINETDIWLNNVDPNTGATLDLPSLLPYKRATNIKSGEWQQVDLAHAQNVIFNTNPARNKYEVETLANDQVRLIFGDGEFADIPKGTFDIWVRSSIADQDIAIPRSAIVNVPQSFTYVDSLSRTQTFTFTVSLINTLQNASAREDIDHIRVTAPGVYYTQDRMVNAQDYNVFPLQDSSILKLRAFNRTFAGDSKYIAWHDPTGSFDNIKIFSDDGMIYFEDEPISSITPQVDISTLITSFLQPLLSSSDLFLQLVSNGVAVSDVRRIFNSDEVARINAALTPPPNPASIALYYNKSTNEWYALKTSATPTDPGTAPFFVDGLGGVGYPTDFITFALITAVQTNITQPIYLITRLARRTIVQSVSTQFWNTNQGNAVIEFDTLNSDLDTIVILKANPDNNRNALMTQNWNFNVLGQEIIDSGPELGLPDVNRISVQSFDVNGDGVPDNVSLNDIINPTITLHSGRQQVLSIATSPWSLSTFPYTANGVYTASITIDGTVFPVNVTVVDFTTYTFTNLVADINTNLAGFGFANVFNGNLIITSNTFGTASTVSIVDTGLFSSITNFLSLDATFAGDSSAPYTGTTITIPVLYITGQGDVTVTGDLTPLANPTDWQEGAPTTDEIVSTVSVTNMRGNITTVIVVKDYVYFSRLTLDDPFVPAPTSAESIESYIQDVLASTNLWTRNNGRDTLNFAWFHRTTQYHLVDPAASNIIDMQIITKGYFTQLKQALENETALPTPPTALDLRTSYNYLLQNAMVSDTVILEPGKLKLLFGSNAIPQLQASFLVVKADNSTLTDNQIKTTIVTTIRNFFDITTWEFGETFFFTELAATIHASLPVDISSVVLVPLSAQNHFGDLFEVLAREDEVFYVDITVDDITIVPSYNATNLRQGS